MKDLLRNPSLLNLASFVTAGVGIAVMVVMIFLALSTQSNNSIKVLALENSGVSVNGATQTGLSLDQTFKVNGQAVKLTWGKNTLVALGGAGGSISQGQIQLTSGTFYLQAENLKLTVGNLTNSPVTLSQFAGAVFVDSSTVVVISGSLKDSKGINFDPNQEIRISTETTQASAFLRQTLTTSAWDNLTKAVTDLEVSQPWLTDRTAPKLVKITPEAGSTIPANVNPVPFVFEADEPGAKISVNGVSGVVGTDGKYSTNMNLSAGATTFTIVLEDKYGNITQTGASYSKLGTPTQPPVSQTCDPQMAQQLLTAINTYRAESGKAALSPIEDLRQVACSHTLWMASVTCNPASQDCAGGKNADTFAQRCQAAGTTCSAENIMAGGGTSATAILDSWKQLSTQSQNLVGDFSQIGIGINSGYVTVLFR